MDELNDCCKMLDQVRGREIERVKAEAAAVVEQLHGRVEELEKIAFEKARAVSSLEGEIAGLKHKLAQIPEYDYDVHVKMPPLRTTPVVVTPVSPVVAPLASPPQSKCSMCGKPCAGMCPACRVYVCDRYDCGVKHGHGEMYTSSA